MNNDSASDISTPQIVVESPHLKPQLSSASALPPLPTDHIHRKDAGRSTPPRCSNSNQVNNQVNSHRIHGMSNFCNDSTCTHFTHTFKSDKLDSQENAEKQIVVLKIGSSSISGPDGRICLSIVAKFTETVCNLVNQGYYVIIVTSGGVSVGCHRLGLKERPTSLVTKQVVAAVGQAGLMRMYDDLFSLLGQPIAQVLLSRENLAQEHHYLNALNTFKELMRMGIVGIVNENDTVAVQELRFGDNDTLSALVASVVRAHWLFLLTDVDALYTSNPRTDPNAKAIHIVPDVNELIVDTGSNADNLSGKWGTGGMSTKIQAASIATSAGVRTVVCSTSHLEHITQILNGAQDVGTQFLPAQHVLCGRKKWIALGLVPLGSITVDAGAAAAVCNKSSLFAAGIVSVQGNFPANSAVRILTSTGKEIGRGVCSYNSDEIIALKGVASNAYESVLGYPGPNTIISRDNIAVFPSSMTPNVSSNSLNMMGIVPGQSSNDELKKTNAVYPETAHSVSNFHSVKGTIDTSKLRKSKGESDSDDDYLSPNACMDN